MPGNTGCEPGLGPRFVDHLEPELLACWKKYLTSPTQTAKADRTLTVEMSDAMRFTPSDMKVKRGETVRFVIKNVGQIKHEFNLGTHQELLEHLEVMKKYPNMEHDEPGKITLDPGQQGEIIWQFTQPGTVELACLIPGHYEAGMRGAIHVGKK